MQKQHFIWRDTSEPHKARRREILAKYPEIKKLFGPEAKTKYITVFLVLIQLVAVYFIHHLSLIPFLVITYVVGATINHMLFALIHDITHNLAFRKTKYNNILALFANLPIAVPMAMGFKKYHFEHHVHQGTSILDTDIPTKKEAVLCGRNPLKKLIWLALFPFNYAIRPLIIYPKPLKKWDIVNLALIVCCDALVVYLFGWQALVYLLLSTYFAMTIHPSATHFIAEHFVVHKSQETYSYYGPLNILFLNFGYHNEHHDFPAVPWSRLHLVKQMAPEYYNQLYAHKSLIKLTIKFIFDPKITLFSRVQKSQSEA